MDILITKSKYRVKVRLLENNLKVEIFTMNWKEVRIFKTNM